MALALIGKMLMPGEFVDTNIVIYSFSQDEHKQSKALAILAKHPVMSVSGIE